MHVARINHLENRARGTPPCTVARVGVYINIYPTKRALTGQRCAGVSARMCTVTARIEFWYPGGIRS
ncbi:hypothetical protein AGR4A_Cc140008 [Agrobacterium tumefaciens str. B6]|uniref:Uncharacterized protein n=1 Tax=Agrobacterium tumefaciens str. B6 TaxID=1183423 RepID=A0A822UXX4_AGRTU|nr:hypothetical protein AGR4A_Cc140008 [Agrobacterium tumefaciens str. B6]